MVHIGFRLRNLRERDHLEYPGMYRNIILKWIFKKWDGRTLTRLAGSGQ